MLHLRSALHLLANFRKTEAALLFVLLPLAKDDLGIDEHQFLRRILSLAQVDDGDALGHGNLRRGQPNTLRGIHGLEHVVDEFLQLRVEFGYRLAGLREHRLGIFDDLQNHFCC